MFLPALLTAAVLAGPLGAGQAVEAPGIEVAVIALDRDLGDHVADVVTSDAPGASVTVVVAVAEVAVGDAALSAVSDVVVLALGEVSLGDRLLADGDLATAIEEVIAGGAVVVAGAGSEAETMGPAPTDVGAVVVGGATAAGQPRPFANRSLRRAVSAPVSGAVADDRLDGTSVAAGHVGAIAALLLAEGRRPAEIAGVLVATAANPFGDVRLGAGYLDAATAVSSPVGEGTASPASAPASTVGDATDPSPTVAAAARPAPGPPVDPSGPVGVAAIVAVVALLGDLALARVAWQRRRWERRGRG